MKVSYACAWCGQDASRERGAINRAKRQGMALYCGRTCSGLGRRNPNPPTDAERRAAKADYDRQYRERDREAKAAKRAAYYQRTRDVEKERAYRKANMARHVEYCRRPDYVAWKREYDRSYRAKKDFGEFWESGLLLLDLHAEITARASRAEIYAANGTAAKTQQRKRAYDQLVRG